MTRRDSLYFRLVARVTSVLVLSGIALFLAILAAARLAVDSSYDKLLVTSAIVLAENTWYANGAISVDVPLAAFSLFSAGDNVLYAVFDAQGRLIAGDANFKPAIPWDKLGAGAIVFDGRQGDIPLRIAVIGRRFPIQESNPWIAIAVAQSMNSRAEFIKDIGGRSMLALLITGLLAVAASVFSLKQALNPLRRIESAIQRRDLDDLTPLEIVAPVEIHALVTSINGFMQRLEASRNVLKRVMANAAHQLRTPVAALISQLDMLDRQDDIAKRARHVTRAQELAASLGALVTQLINHAMIQHRTSSAQRELIDIVRLARMEAAAYLSRLNRPVEVHFESSPVTKMILGEPISIREAVRNVLSNALQYGARTFLNIAVTEAGSNIELRVTEDGPGIPADRWDLVRQPFSPRTSERHGVSLGLAIVEEAMRLQGGHLRFEANQGSFTVVLSFSAAPLKSE